MPEEMYSQMFGHLLATYGPAAIPMVGLLLALRYFLEKDKERENKYAIEMEAERERTRAERKRGDDLMVELLKEARGNAMLAEELKIALRQLAKGDK